MMDADDDAASDDSTEESIVPRASASLGKRQIRHSDHAKKSKKTAHASSSGGTAASMSNLGSGGSSPKASSRNAVLDSVKRIIQFD